MYVIAKPKLEQLYLTQGKSMQEIASSLNCSLHKVKYWIDKHSIKTRSISDAIYTWHNPNGDPFAFRLPQTKEEERLFGLGLGLYWGEGTKSAKTVIRLGNTDPRLIQAFVKFLIVFFGVKKSDLKFGLQIFTDLDPSVVIDFWIKKLKVNKAQFQKPVVTISGSIGTYKHKSQYGVVTVHYNNVKATRILQSLLPV